MVRQCFLANTGIQFYRQTFKHIGLDPATLFPFVTPRPAALEPSASCVAEAKPSTYCPEESDMTRTDEVQASPIAACRFKTGEQEALLPSMRSTYQQLEF